MIRFLAPALAFLLLCPLSARADAIDGTWCRGARTIHIDGPTIRTPGGKSLKGQYDRHGFSYTGPKGGYWAEKSVRMDLLDDETLQLVAGEKGKAETWRRCKPTT